MANDAAVEYKRESIKEVVRIADMKLDAINRYDRTKKKEIGTLMEKIKEMSTINEKDYIISYPASQQATIEDKKTGAKVEIKIDENNRVIIVDGETGTPTPTEPTTPTIPTTPEGPTNNNDNNNNNTVVVADGSWDENKKIIHLK